MPGFTDDVKTSAPDASDSIKTASREGFMLGSCKISPSMLGTSYTEINRQLHTFWITSRSSLNASAILDIHNFLNFPLSSSSFRLSSSGSPVSGKKDEGGTGFTGMSGEGERRALLAVCSPAPCVSGPASTVVELNKDFLVCLRATSESESDESSLEDDEDEDSDSWAFFACGLTGNLTFRTAGPSEPEESESESDEDEDSEEDATLRFRFL